MCLQVVLLVIALSCCCYAASLGAPSLRLNSRPVKHGSDVFLTSGSAFNLSCHGNGSLSLSSTAWTRLSHSLVLVVDKATPKNTGTYTCSSAPSQLPRLSTWIHLYVTDSSDESSVFSCSARTLFTLMEGSDFLIKCLLTDPSVTDLRLLAMPRGRSLPPGMNVTFDPRRGAVVHRPQTSFSGTYVCSGLKDGRHVISKPFQLLVQKRLPPPSVSISQPEFVRLTGEPFEVWCVSSNPSHLYNLTWTHSRLHNLNATVVRHSGNKRVLLNSTVRVPAVSGKHAGVYTCRAASEFGVSQATAELRVLERPYVKIHLKLSWTSHANSSLYSQHGNPSSTWLIANVSTEEASIANISTIEAYSANVSTPDVDSIVNVSRAETSDASISSSRVEVPEDVNLMLTFEIEAYPPISSQDWTLPAHLDTQHSVVRLNKHHHDDIRSELSLLLRRVRPKDQGPYFFHFSNAMLNVSHRVDVLIYRAPSTSITVDKDTLTCVSSGFPRPNVLMFFCPGLQHTCANASSNHVSPTPAVTREGAELRTHIHLPPQEVTVECVASNMMGESRSSFKNRRLLSPSVLTLPLIGSVSVAAVLLVLLSVVCHRYRQRPKYEIRWKIVESYDGNSYTFVDPSQLPYNQKWEFPRDKLRLGAVLGSGAFGKVVEAAAYGLGTEDQVTKVAVKMLKPRAHSEERHALMSELKILSHLGYHDNIVNLLGACTRGGPMLMITEYCCHGDLLNFLRTHGHTFVTSECDVHQTEYKDFITNNQEQRLRSDSGIYCCSDYLDMKPLSSSGQTQLLTHTECLHMWDLLWFSVQIAQGLDFLSSKNCIHRDVAARNVLLTDRRVAKICDFGLARDIRDDDSYIVQGNARLPVKWMSPESIFDCVYTVQSDVWSYGVLLWELFTLGQSPYPNVVVDTNFYQMIKDGRQMEQPEFAPAEMYQLMRQCWSLQPTHRPTFKTIGQHINKLLPRVDDWPPHHSTGPSYENVHEREGEREESKERGQIPRADGDETMTMMKNIYQHS